MSRIGNKRKDRADSVDTGNVQESEYFQHKSRKTGKNTGNCYQNKPGTVIMQVLPIIRYNAEFFNQECLQFAKALLGQLIVRVVDGERLTGFVVETECYLGVDDAASHSYQGKQTSRNEPMFMKPGTSYVYSIYGMYHCFNISTKGDGTCVLIRALQPFEGTETMEKLRQERRKANRKLSFKELCSGPSKLCQALNITKNSCNKVDIAVSDSFWVENGPDIPPHQIVTSKRIGIESAGKVWSEKALRFYVIGNSCVSVRDRAAERLLNESVCLPAS